MRTKIYLFLFLIFTSAGNFYAQPQKKLKNGKSVTPATKNSKQAHIRKRLVSKKKRDTKLKKSLHSVVRSKRRTAKRNFHKNPKKNLVSRRSTPKKVSHVPARSRTTQRIRKKSAVDEAAVKPELKTVDYLDSSAKDISLNRDFLERKGQLRWPMDQGTIKVQYGTYTMEGIKIRGNNPGITIVTPSVNTDIRSIFEGEVAAVGNLGDGTMAVTIRHGKYFSTYSHLSSVSVTKNESVTDGQVIGTAGPDEDSDQGLFDFMLMNELNTENPSKWLRK